MLEIGSLWAIISLMALFSIYELEKLFVRDREKLNRDRLVVSSMAVVILCFSLLSA